MHFDSYLALRSNVQALCPGYLLGLTLSLLSDILLEQIIIAHFTFITAEVSYH